MGSDPHLPPLYQDWEGEIFQGANITRRHWHKPNTLLFEEEKAKLQNLYT